MQLHPFVGARAWAFHAVRQGAAHGRSRHRLWRLDADAWLAVAGHEPFVLAPEAGADVVSLRADAADAVDAGRPAAIGGHLLPMSARAAAAFERRDAGALVIAATEQDAAWRARSLSFGCSKDTTREQLLERILVASDFIASRFDEPICLDEMARAASLSRFHFTRLFRIVHGEAPHAFLVTKRAAVARRRLACGDDVSEAASRAGFGSRSSLFRGLRKTRHAPPGEPCFRSA